jgi:hypothetical protein
MKLHGIAHDLRQALDCMVYGQLDKMHELIDKAHEASLELRYSTKHKEYHANDDEVIQLPRSK